MKFILPGVLYEEAAREYIQEFYDFGSPIHGAGGLDKYIPNRAGKVPSPEEREQDRVLYQAWLKKVYAGMDIANVQEGKVPGFTYFYVREEDDRIVGMISIRLALNDFLLREGGHIGYCIRPAERRKGYGTRMLRETLVFCKGIGLNRVLITCDKSNIASAGVAQGCGGVLENELYSETYGEVIQRYWIG